MYMNILNQRLLNPEYYWAKIVSNLNNFQFQTLTKTSKKQNIDQTDTAAEPTDTLTVDADADQTVKASKGDFVDTFSRVINGEKVSDLQPDLFSGGVLRKYQLDGMEWLKVNNHELHYIN